MSDPQTTSEDDVARPPPEESEFGKGYVYCLGLFIAHEFRLFEYEQKKATYMDASMWFSGAADHLFELQTPNILPEEKKKQIAEFQDRCLRFRLCMNGEKCDWKDAHTAVDEAKDLLREWDEFNGIPTIKGSWQ